MRVLLVQAFTALDMELVYPIGLSYLAAHLDGHEVRIFDLNLHRESPYPALEAADAAAFHAQPWHREAWDKALAES